MSQSATVQPSTRRRASPAIISGRICRSKNDVLTAFEEVLRSVSFVDPGACKSEAELEP